jgi:hypothetical protein
MSLSPVTLMEEDEVERQEREAVSGVLGTGHMVRCHPNPEDPEIVQIQSRVVCLTKPHTACPTCPHSLFTLAFNSNRKTERFCLVSCPRWASESERMHGTPPESYVSVEEATCEARPFNFCTSCPSRVDVLKSGADKTKQGWYGRWNRLKESEDG